jgi:hypothetical protein
MFDPEHKAQQGIAARRPNRQKSHAALHNAAFL